MSCNCYRELINSDRVTECVCGPADGPFTCIRHRCEKNPHLVALCKTHPEFFDVWERGQGPNQLEATPITTRQRIGLGDLVAGLVKVATLGRVKMCDKCQARRSRWNRWLSVPVPGMNDLRALASWLGGDDAVS